MPRDLYEIYMRSFGFVPRGTPSPTRGPFAGQDRANLIGQHPPTHCQRPSRTILRRARWPGGRMRGYIRMAMVARLEVLNGGIRRALQGDSVIRFD